MVGVAGSPSTAAASRGTSSSISVGMLRTETNEVASYATHLIAMREGEIVAQGEAGAIVDGELVESVFGLPCTVIPCPETGAPMVVPAARVQRAR